MSDDTASNDRRERVAREVRRIAEMYTDQMEPSDSELASLVDAVLAALVGETGEHSDLADYECSFCFRTPNDLQHGLPPRPGSTAAALPHSKGDSTP